MGGEPYDGPINVPDHVMSDWEVLADAMNMTLVAKGLYPVDRFRHAVEKLERDTYLSFSYFERWIGGIERMLVELDVLTTEEIDQRAAELRARWT
jgi:nitrile hydratase